MFVELMLLNLEDIPHIANPLIQEPVNEKILEQWQQLQ